MTDKLSQETDDVLSSLDDQEQTLGGMTEDTENTKSIKITERGNGFRASEKTKNIAPKAVYANMCARIRFRRFWIPKNLQGVL